MAHQIAFFKTQHTEEGVYKNPPLGLGVNSVFGLGRCLAEKGKKVIIVDCNPNCGLTATISNIEEIYQNSSPKTPKHLKDGLSPAFDFRPYPLSAVECVKIEENLYLLPGHSGVSEYEYSLSIAQMNASYRQSLKNLPGTFYELFQKTAECYQADYILLNMSDQTSAMNQNLIMTSDFFVLQMRADMLSSVAIESFTKMLPKWKNWADYQKNLPEEEDRIYPFPNKNPCFLGDIIEIGVHPEMRGKDDQNHSIVHYIKNIRATIDEKLVPILKDNQMVSETLRQPYNIMKIDWWNETDHSNIMQNFQSAAETVLTRVENA